MLFYQHPAYIINCIFYYLSVTILLVKQPFSPQKGRWLIIRTNQQKNQTKTNFYKHNHILHHVCSAPTIYTIFDQNKTNTYTNRQTTPIYHFNHNITTSYSILTIINRFTSLSRLIVHLSIIIVNLLSIYSSLFIFLVVYIVYYFSLFLEEKNKISKILENLHFDLEKLLFFKPARGR